MTSFNRVALAGAFALGLAGVAHAQTIPSPTNPTPRHPIATDGSPLPYRGGDDGGLLTGRSAFAPVGAVGGGLGIAGQAVGAGLGTAGAVIDGTPGAIAR